MTNYFILELEGNTIVSSHQLTYSYEDIEYDPDYKIFLLDIYDDNNFVQVKGYELGFPYTQEIYKYDGQILSYMRNLQIDSSQFRKTHIFPHQSEPSFITFQFSIDTYFLTIYTINQNLLFDRSSLNSFRLRDNYVDRIHFFLSNKPYLLVID